MSFSDPIASMLTSFRNASLRNKPKVIIPFSNFKWLICQKLVKHHFLKEIAHDEENRSIIAKIQLFNRECVIKEIKTISKSSQHFYVKSNKILSFCKNKSRFGLYLISTSKGLMTQKEAIQNNSGGKVLFYIS